MNLLHARKVCNTSAQGLLPFLALTPTIQGMPQPKHTFRSLIEAAAKPHRELWKSSGELNLGALERFYEARGHKISQASFSRIFAKRQTPGEDTIEATHRVFHIPRVLLRGEPMSAEMEKLFTDYKLSTLLLAQKIESLPKDDYYLICQQIERAIETQEKVRQALKSGNVTPLHKSRQD